MTAKERRIDQNIEHWRNLSPQERRKIMRSNAVSRVANSMAMEGEPVSEQWIKNHTH